MIRAAILSLALLATPVFAQDGHDHDHDDHHVAEAGGIRAVHAWTNATGAGTALVYVEIENTSETTVTLIGAESDIAVSAELVGLQNTGGELVYTVLPAMPIPANSELMLSPNGLAIRLSGLTRALVEGEDFEIEFEFEDVHLHAHVEIESATATRHSHAGHNH